MSGKWAELVDPLAKKLEVTAAFDLSFTFNAVGAGAHAKVLRQMGRVCDIAADQHRELIELRERVRKLEVKSERKQWLDWLFPW